MPSPALTAPRCLPAFPPPLHPPTTHCHFFQVCASFGPNLSPTELLMDYGFVDAANSNDKVELMTAAVGERKGRGGGRTAQWEREGGAAEGGAGSE